MKFYRTTVNVQDETDDQLILIIPQWKRNYNDHEITVSKSEVPDELLEKIDPSDSEFLIADVNLRAENEEDLVVKNFEDAPDPKPLDELADD